MTTFNSFAVVDWSAGNDRGPRPCKDAIWIGAVLDGVEIEPVYCRNRQVALEQLEDLIRAERAAQRRLMIGFDFPFSYPKGFAEQVTGVPDPLRLWAWFARHLEDSPRRNNRFALAGHLNTHFPGIGPFWFNGTKDDIPALPRKGRARRNHGLSERRLVEEQAKGTFTCWQMGGAGAVGGQVMTGLAALQCLRSRFEGMIAVWPFELSDQPIVFTEIWPSLIDQVVKASDDPIRDRAQVRLLARAFANLPPTRVAKMMEIEAPEEGWILGLGHETELQDAACRL